MPVILGTSKQYSGFSPQSIPGLTLWLDGADSTTITGTTNVTAWKDKSSNGYTFSGSGAAATNPGLNFNGSAYLTNGSITAISAPYTVLAVGSSTSQPNTFQRMISGGVKTGDPYDAILAVGTSNTTPFVWFGYSGNWLANPYLTGSSYSGTNVLLTGGTVTSGTSPTLVGYVNGSQLSSVTGAAYQATSITGINIGGGYSSATAGLQPWYGNINEVLIYNGVLTTSQRQQVEGYLAQKWGLGTSFVGGVTKPTQIPGCVVWLDAADSSTITSSSSLVSQWVDKASGLPLVQATSTAQPVLTTLAALNNLPVLNLYSGSTLRNMRSTATATFTGPQTAFMVFYLTSGGNLMTEIGAYPAQYRYLYTGNGTLSEYAPVTGTHRTFQQGTNASVIYTAGTAYVTMILDSNATANISDAALRLNGVNSSTLNFYSSQTAVLGGMTDNFAVIGYGTAASYLGEVIYYNRALSSTEYQAVEGYLATKWGLRGSLPSTHPYYTGSAAHPFALYAPVTRPFQPSDIAACALWLDAAQDTTTPGSYVTSLPDRSGNNVSVIPSAANTITLAGNTLNGLPVYNFGANLAENASFNWTISFTQFVVVKGTGSWMCAQYDTGYNSYILTNNYGLLGVNYKTSGYVLEDSDVLQGTSIFSQTPTGTTGWQIFSIGYTAGSSTATNYAVNGTPRVGGVVIQGSPTSTTQASYKLWLNGRGNVAVDTSLVAEFLHFNTALTDSQRQQIEGYLAQKWGLSGSLVAGIASPLRISGCVMWFDAADSNTLTKSGTTVTGWTNKSGQSAASTGSGTVSINQAYLNGVSSVRFPAGTNYLSVGAITYTTTQRAIFIVAKQGSISTTFTSVYLTSSAALAGQLYIYNDVLQYNKNGTLGMYETSPPNLYNSTAIISISTPAGNQGFWINGANQTLDANNMTSSFFTTGTSTTGDIIIGGGPATTAILDLYELIQYDGSLTTTQRQQVEGYLATKWGLRGSLPSTHPYYVSASPHPFTKFAPPSTRLLAPTQIPGCALWLDAADSSTITFSSGINVSQWSDKSGNGINATVLNGTPTYTQSLGMTFNGSSALQVPYTASPTIESLFVVIKFNSVAAQGNIFSGTATGQREYLMYSPYNPGTIYLGRYGTGPSGSVNGGTVTTSTNYILEYVFNGTANTISFYQQGNTITSGTPQFTYSAGGTISAIGSYNGNGYLQGQIYEIIVYNVALTTSQRQAIEGYLAQKWGLTSSLPSTHPYVKIPPAMPQ